jgi:hypothetical protein
VILGYSGREAAASGIVPVEQLLPRMLDLRG